MPEKKIDYSWVILVIGVMTVMGALGFARFGYTSILPAMKAGLELNDAQAGDLASGNLAGYLALALTCGFLASKFGPRLVIGIFLSLSAFAMFLTGISDDFLSAFLARTLTGMGSGGANVPVMGLVSAWFATRKRGLAAGIVVSGSSFGLLVTGILVPAILGADKVNGWRNSWFVLGAITLCIAILCFFFLRNRPTGERDSAPKAGEETPKSGGWASIYKNPSVWQLAFIYTLFGFSYIIYSTFYIRYLTNESGFSMEMAGYWWAAVGGSSVASGLIWGGVSDRIGRKKGMAIVFFLQATSYLLFGAFKSPAGYIASSILFALTAWSIPAIMAATVGDLLGSKLAPAALGFVTFFFGIGQVAGPFVSGRIAVSTGSYSLAFIIAGATALAGGLACLTIGRRQAQTSVGERE